MFYVCKIELDSQVQFSWLQKNIVRSRNQRNPHELVEDESLLFIDMMTDWVTDDVFACRFFTCLLVIQMKIPCLFSQQEIKVPRQVNEEEREKKSMKKDGNEDKQKAQYSLPSGSTRVVYSCSLQSIDPLLRSSSYPMAWNERESKSVTLMPQEKCVIFPCNP